MPASFMPEKKKHRGGDGVATERYAQLGFPMKHEKRE